MCTNANYVECNPALKCIILYCQFGNAYTVNTPQKSTTENWIRWI